MKSDLFDLITKPIVSEKSIRVADANKQFVFQVVPKATKPQIKKAVEAFFNVVVTSVQTTNSRGKTKRFKQKDGKQKDFKKAYVCLAEGHDIDFLSAD